MNLNILSKLLIPSLSLLHQNQNEFVDWYEYITNSTFSISIASFGIFIASSLYKLVYSSLQNLKFCNLVAKKGSKRILWDKIVNVIYDWSYNRGYIDWPFPSYFFFLLDFHV
ncbi:hypothetical protein NC651_008399 [Populus alba x Populus x berolinensis]|nr:hypothetical protein NC651_008399 [Populus alba x Populus x berolinensis]